MQKVNLKELCNRQAQFNESTSEALDFMFERIAIIEDFLQLDEECEEEQEDECHCDPGCMLREEPKTHKAPPEMQLFFEKLLKLKAECKKNADEQRYKFDGPVWEYVHNELNKIIKEKQ